MSLQLIPGFSSFTKLRVTESDKKAIGRLNDSEEYKQLASLGKEEYDAKIVALYTQTQLTNTSYWNNIQGTSPMLFPKRSEIGLLDSFEDFSIDTSIYAGSRPRGTWLTLDPKQREEMKKLNDKFNTALIWGKPTK